MPVIDGVFVPRTPLSPAELHVDWAGHNTHLVSRRTTVEDACTPAARRLALLASQANGIPTTLAVTALQGELQHQLDTTARFGYRSAQAEIAKLRADHQHTALAGLVIPDAGRYGRLAARGLAGVATLVAQRALESATAIAATVTTAVQQASAAGTDTLLAATTSAKRALHNHVLELVGETLNVGRTAGALSLPSIPEYALRSEQLDLATCGPCDELHGTIVQVGSPDYFAILPPIGCLGGGRCRGIMVFGDQPLDVRAPVEIAA